MTPERISHLRELLGKASPVPWRKGPSGYRNYIQTVEDAGKPVVVLRPHEALGPTVAEVVQNGTLIVAAVNDLPELLDELERLRPALKELVKDVEECLEELDPCGTDCSEFHNLSLETLPAARRALTKEPT